MATGTFLATEEATSSPRSEHVVFQRRAWWIEGVRHALLPGGGPSSIGGTGSLWTAVTGTVAPDAPTIVASLLATGALVTLVSTGVFRVSERRAKDRGLLDRTTGS